ncbi:hypothetical protein [Saccharothrix violaceirubra]|uniref:Uncharacterized protein n=1 Tax=Saccharothrix violaceirubra TaxID=413306 RepID=A0A7W7WZE2_9PSEU|nr:hypothetical protein [Saccharothrix violaceirubra]MBB4969395.1 hypothetical protein [Saccharothrix violaceirubra]
MDELPGGLSFDRSRAEAVRYYPERSAERRSGWVAGVFSGLAGAVLVLGLAVVGVDRLGDSRWFALGALGLAGLVLGLLCLGRLSPAAPLVAGVVLLIAAGVSEVRHEWVSVQLKVVFASGVPVGLGVLLVVVGAARR